MKKRRGEVGKKGIDERRRRKRIRRARKRRRIEEIYMFCTNNSYAACVQRGSMM